MAGSCLSVMYHYVRDSAATRFPRIRALSPDLFEQQLDWLQRGYTLIGVEEIETALAGGTPLPERAALLTFDDGFTDHYETVFPILRRRGLRGVFFLSRRPYETPSVLGVHKVQFLLAHLGAQALADSVRAEREPAMAAAAAGRDAVFGADHWEHADERSIKTLLNYELPIEEAGRILDVLFDRHIGSQEAFTRDLYLRTPMIAEMASGGMSFGYHTHSHRMLSRLTEAEQERELQDGVGWIKQLTGQSRVSFCYPWGGAKTYNRQTVSLLERYGYSVAFTSERRRTDLTRDAAMELPRVDTRDLPPHVSEDAAPDDAPVEGES
jgi:peptidoglycan/xylan/chitin deacetylase (PgdA/CDA1 family)